MKEKPNGYLELYDGYRFIEGGCSEGVKEDMVDDARTFFRKYRDLFYKAWKDEIDLSEVQDYFRKKV